MKSLQKLEQELEGVHFSPEGGRAVYYLYNYLIINSYVDENPGWELKKYFASLAGVYRNHIVKWFYIVVDGDTFVDAALIFIREKGRLQRLERVIIDVRDEMVQKFATVNLKKASNEELSALAEHFCTQFMKIVHCASVIRTIDRGIIAIVKRHTPLEKVDEVLRRLSLNTEPSISIQEEIALLELACGSGKLDLQGIYDKFFFSTLGYYNEPPKTFDYYEKRLAEIKAGDYKGKLAEIKNKIKGDAEEKEVFVKTLPTELHEIAKLAGDSTYIKDFYKYSINKFQYSAEPLFAEISKRQNVSIENLKDSSPEEFIACASGEPLNLVAIKERQELNIVIMSCAETSVLTDTEAIYIENKYIQSDHAGKIEFKGRVASTGYAKATARVILEPKDFSKMRKGDVLVVINTSPDFVPIMHLASAIVSEEGGLTAHVSVVSREFGIPCVVGIRNITEVIKDDMMIEVDAQNGIVKII